MGFQSTRKALARAGVFVVVRRHSTGWNEFWVDDVSATSATTPSGIALAVATVAALGRA